MKKGIHPKYYTNAKVTCACGASFTVGSTMPELHVEICSQCHPFYTKVEKVLDTAGRVEKFRQRQAAGAAGVGAAKKKVAKKAAKATAEK